MKLILAVFVFFLCQEIPAQPISKVWVAENGYGTYKNPIIHADYSDPDAIRVGDDYYMISSSFNHVPGLPILHSKDLVNWKLIGHALKKLPSPYFDTVRHGAGVWAPSIRYHNNEFYIYYPDPDFGIYLVKSKNINGPWTDPVLVLAGKGLIDPCPLWDDDGMVYLIHAYAGSRTGFKSILVVNEMNKDGTRITSDPILVFDGNNHSAFTVEGPKFYKRNGYYYIFAPAGGVSDGWQVVLRSKNVYGPYENRQVLLQGKTTFNGPHQGAWLVTQTGENWFIHFQDKEAYGRVVLLEPMYWIDDWPVIGIDYDGNKIGEPVAQYRKPYYGTPFNYKTPPDTDEFNTTRLGLQWQWQANPGEGWAFPTSEGYLKMFSTRWPDTLQPVYNCPAMLMQKFPAEKFMATVKLEFHPRHEKERFALMIFGTDYAFVSVQNRAGRFFITYNECNKADKGNPETETLIKEVNIPGVQRDSHTVYLRVKVADGALCHFSFSEDGKIFTDAGKSFTAKPGKWVGAKVGMVCLRNNITNDAGYADIDWFRVEELKY